MPTTNDNKREPFHFVFTHPASEQDRKRETQLARSHTARVNRENRPPTRIASRSAVPARPKKLARRVPVEGVIENERSHVDVTTGLEQSKKVEKEQQWPETRRKEGSDVEATSLSSSTERSSRQPCDVLAASLLAPSTRTIAPIVGAPSSATFQLGTTHAEMARAAHYCIKVIWPDLLMDRDATRVWWATFREQPIIFHSFHFALTVHHDVLTSKAEWSISRAGLLHKTKSIRLLNQILSNLSDDNIEFAILAVLVLASNELKPDKVITAEASMFDPHMPRGNWNSVYARMEQVPEHGKALYLLIQKRGGPREIRLAGLAAVLAFSDILSASYALTKPIFPIFWHEELGDLLLTRQNLFPTSAIDINSGRGFRQKVPSGLPHHASMIFTNLSIVDQIMEQCRGTELQDEHKRVVVSVRNSAHHRLLSLASWEELDAIDRSIYERVSYECCRLTVLLYSNAVIFPIPPHSGYPSSLLEQITVLLSPQVLEEWGQNTSPLLIWVLVIGGIASFGSPHRVFFEKTLADILAARDYEWPKNAVHAAVKEYLWTDGACRRGFEDLWDSLRMHLGTAEELGS